MAAQLLAVQNLAIAVAGMPVQATLPTTLTLGNVHAVIVQGWPTNGGNLYVGDRQTMNKTTGVGVLYVIPAPTATSYPSWSSAVTHGANAVPLSKLWLDADVSGDKALISVIVV